MLQVVYEGQLLALSNLNCVHSVKMRSKIRSDNVDTSIFPRHVLTFCVPPDLISPKSLNCKFRTEMALRSRVLWPRVVDDCVCLQDVYHKYGMLFRQH